MCQILVGSHLAHPDIGAQLSTINSCERGKNVGSCAVDRLLLMPSAKERISFILAVCERALWKILRPFLGQLNHE